MPLDPHSEKLTPKPADFLLGINDPHQLATWLKEQEHSRGVCFVGRSNVGKSSLINMLCGKKTARVSKTPGRTQQINIFGLRFKEPPSDVKSSNSPAPYDFYLLDLPGYGHANVSKAQAKNWQILIETLFTYLPLHYLLVVLQDARHFDTLHDQIFYEYIKPFKVTQYLILNKIDKLKTQKERHECKSKQEAFLKKYKKVDKVFYVSSLEGTGIRELMTALKMFLC